VDSRLRGNDVYPVRTLTIVIPAKAGIHGCHARSRIIDINFTLAPRLRSLRFPTAQSSQLYSAT